MKASWLSLIYLNIAFDAEISEFVAAIEEKRASSVGFEDGRLALVLAEAALKSITEGRVVAARVRELRAQIRQDVDEPAGGR